MDVTSAPTDVSLAWALNRMMGFTQCSSCKNIYREMVQAFHADVKKGMVIIGECLMLKCFMGGWCCFPGGWHPPASPQLE